MRLNVLNILLVFLNHSCLYLQGLLQFQYFVLIMLIHHLQISDFIFNLSSYSHFYIHHLFLLLYQIFFAFCWLLLQFFGIILVDILIWNIHWRLSNIQQLNFVILRTGVGFWSCLAFDMRVDLFSEAPISHSIIVYNNWLVLQYSNIGSLKS